ncbi:MAG: aminodeoxychorismate lyase [gamma proteobacterium symbiont of Ctena orbiculata]
MLINGKPDDRIAGSDRGLQYGDGLFETLAVNQGRPCLWRRHMARLGRGESVLGMPASDKQLLEQEALSLCEGRDQAVLKIILTRGSGGRGYARPSPCAPRRILSIHPWPDYPRTWYTDGLRLGICQTRIGLNSQLAGLKHLNRLEQVLARSECQEARLDECLMMDEGKRVICGSQSNFFMVRDDTLYTPDLTHSGITGVVRELVIELARQLSIPLLITDLDLQSLLDADALFVTNSVMGICPVAVLDKRRYDLERIPIELRRRAEQACMAS